MFFSLGTKNKIVLVAPIPVDVSVSTGLLISKPPKKVLKMKFRRTYKPVDERNCRDPAVLDNSGINITKHVSVPSHDSNNLINSRTCFEISSCVFSGLVNVIL